MDNTCKDACRSLPLAFRGTFRVIAICAVMAVVAGLGYELFRNKGEILVIGTARESGSEVILNLVVKNRDWRVSLSNFAFGIDAHEFWDLKAVRKPQNVNVETNIYGPNNEWTAIDVSLKRDWTLKAGEKFEAEFVLRRKSGGQPRINGSVYYFGASIGDMVNPEQMNIKSFDILIETTEHK